jgi:transposase
VDENRELKAALAKALARIEALEEENRKLRDQLRQNSRNSSKPPSSDMGRRKAPKALAGRSPGGQPGHAGATREIVPPEQVDEVVDRDPETCANCGTPLVDAARIDADVRQIVETPEFKGFVREFRLWKKRCPKCGGFTRGKVPPGSPKGAFGPRIQATAAMLSGRFRMSRREVKALMGLMAGVEMSLGSVQACCEAASEAMAETHGNLHAEVKAASAVHADETGFGRCGDLRMWLWNATSGLTEVFRLLPGRGAAQAKDLLGEGFSGILHRDRWKPYEHLPSARSQLCHAHLRRHFQAMLEGEGVTATQGAMLKLASDRAFHLWHQFERGEIDRLVLIQKMKPIQKEVRRRLSILRDHPSAEKKARGIAKDLLRQWEFLWTYVHLEGAVPTNNEAERALRKAVLWRKGSFGVNSLQGAVFVERILTLAGTTRRRGLDLLDWLTRAIQAGLDGNPSPPLRPL